MNTKITILIAVYEGEKHIKEQISSIISRCGNVSIVLSIDPSTDKSEFICNNIAQQQSNITVLPTIGRFGGAASNFFRLIRDVEFSDSNYIAFSDQDDIWYPDKLYRAIQMLTENNCDGYSSNVIAFWPDGKQKLIDKALPQVQWDYLFESAGPGCTFVMTRKLALEVQAFVRVNQKAMVSVWMHDWFIYAFARSHHYTWYIDKYPSMLYRQHDSNQVGVNVGYNAFLYRMFFVLSGKALYQSSLLATLCGLENHPFVKRWHKHSRLGLLYLAFHAYQCRRSWQEKLYFFFSCLLLAIVGQKKI